MLDLRGRAPGVWDVGHKSDYTAIWHAKEVGRARVVGVAFCGEASGCAMLSWGSGRQGAACAARDVGFDAGRVGGVRCRIFPTRDRLRLGWPRVLRDPDEHPERLASSRTVARRRDACVVGSRNGRGGVGAGRRFTGASGHAHRSTGAPRGCFVDEVSRHERTGAALDRRLRPRPHRLGAGVRGVRSRSACVPLRYATRGVAAPSRSVHESRTGSRPRACHVRARR